MTHEQLVEDVRGVLQLQTHISGVSVLIASTQGHNALDMDLICNY